MASTIGYDNNWVLYCENCRAIIEYEESEIEWHDHSIEEGGGRSRGLLCPSCGHFVPIFMKKRCLLSSELPPDIAFRALKDSNFVVLSYPKNSETPTT